MGWGGGVLEFGVRRRGRGEEGMQLGEEGVVAGPLGQEGGVQAPGFAELAVQGLQGGRGGMGGRGGRGWEREILKGVNAAWRFGWGAPWLAGSDVVETMYRRDG